MYLGVGFRLDEHEAEFAALMNGVEKRCVRITHREDYQTWWVAIKAVMAGHSYLRRHHHRFSSSDRY